MVVEFKTGTLKPSIMRKLAVIFLGVLFITAGLMANNEPTREEWKAMSRAERRAHREKVAMEQKQQLIEVVNTNQWVLEANTLQLKSGETFHIQSNLNFIAVSDENAVVQLGSDSRIGLNGVGGVTVEGRITKKEINEGRKPQNPVTITMNVMGGAMGHTNLTIHVSPNGSATATVKDINGNQLTYRGQLVHQSQSSVFQGQKLF